MRHFIGTIALVTTICLVALTGCSTVEDWFGSADDKAPLPGERKSIIQLQKKLEAPDITLDAEGFVAPEPWRNTYWPQAGGFPNHALQHLALSDAALSKQWALSIGKGGSDKHPLTVAPIVADGRVYTMDAAIRVSAFDAVSGDSVWRTDLPREDDDIFLGGGLAYDSGQIFATTGFSELVALDAADGSIDWTARLPSPARTPPTLVDGRIFVVTIDNRLIALSQKDGSELWSFQGIAASAGLLGGAAPAANQNIVIAAFSSGELFAFRPENGSVAWSDNLAPVLRMGGVSGLSDIRALPVIDNGLVFAISYGGRMVAIDERLGNRVWQREIGGDETPWIAGNHLFLLGADNQLVAMGRESGAIRWVLPLPVREDPNNLKSDLIQFTAPILAGGRLWLANSAGQLIEVDPVTGTITRETTLGEAVTLPPVIADGTLYLLAHDGTLMAFR